MRNCLTCLADPENGCSGGECEFKEEGEEKSAFKRSRLGRSLVLLVGDEAGEESGNGHGEEGGELEGE